MENSETRQRVINLGKSLISEYDLDKSTDTLLHWLIHYLAEKLEILSNSEGKIKNDTEKQCVDTILKIWSRRHFLPDGIRPFDKFDSVLRGLARLDNQSPYPYYNEFQQFSQDIPDDESTETKKWVNIAIKIDNAARTLVDESFKIAAEHARDKKTKDLLDNAPNLSDDDIRVIRKFYSENKTQPNETELLELRRKKLKTKLDRIKAMANICNQYAKRIQSELEEVR